MKSVSDPAINGSAQKAAQAGYFGKWTQQPFA